MSAPAWRNAATRKSVPEPVTPPKTPAAIGALMSAATMPVEHPGHHHVRRGQVAPDDEQGEEAETVAATRPSATQPRMTKIVLSELGGDADVTHDGGVAEVREVGEATDDDGGDHATDDELADRPVRCRGRSMPAEPAIPAMSPMTAATIANAAAGGYWNGGGIT